MKQTHQNDYIQWAIGHAKKHPDPAELTESVISKRLAVLCFAAIQSSVISITNAVFDLASSPNCQAHLDAMREEVLRELDRARAEDHQQATPGATGGSTSRAWRRAALFRMARVDSCLRESMRLNGFVARGIMKRVVAEGGVTLPDGSHLPKGTNVGVSQYSVHRDEDVYRDANTFKAFRFVDEDGEGRGLAPSEKSAARRTRALVSTSPTFLAFSHGPNSW